MTLAFGTFSRVPFGVRGSLFSALSFVSGSLFCFVFFISLGRLLSLVASFSPVVVFTVDVATFYSRPRSPNRWVFYADNQVIGLRKITERGTPKTRRMRRKRWSSKSTCRLINFVLKQIWPRLGREASSASRFPSPFSLPLPFFVLSFVCGSPWLAP